MQTSAYLRLTALSPPASRRSSELPDRLLKTISCVAEETHTLSLFGLTCFRLAKHLGKVLLFWFAPTCNTNTSPVSSTYRDKYYCSFNIQHMEGVLQTTLLTNCRSHFFNVAFNLLNKLLLFDRIIKNFRFRHILDVWVGAFRVIQSEAPAAGL